VLLFFSKMKQEMRLEMKPEMKQQIGNKPIRQYLATALVNCAFPKAILDITLMATVFSAAISVGTE